MRKKLLVFSLSTLVAFTFFIATAIYQLYSFSFELNGYYAKKPIEYKKSFFIEFSYCKPFITAYQLGLRFSGLKESNPTGKISHQSPLEIYINPWKFKVKITYNGTSIGHFNPVNAGYGSSITSDIKLSSDFSFSFKLVQLLIQKKLFETINYINRFKLEINNITVTDLDSKEEIFKANNSSALLTINHPYYHSLAETISSPPTEYNLEGEIGISKAVYYKKIAPISLIYGYLTNTDLTGKYKITLLPDLQNFSFKRPLDNSTLKVVCEECKNINADFSLNTQLKFAHRLKELSLESIFKIKDEFLTQLPQWYIKWVNLVTKYDSQLGIFLTKPKNLLPNIDTNEKFILNVAGKVNLTGEKASIDIDKLILKNSSDTGIMATGKLNFDNSLPIEFTSKGNILLSNYSSLIDYWNNYYSQKLGGALEKDREDLNKAVLKDYLKLISEYPSSKSKDLSFSIEFDSKANSFVVSQRDTATLIPLFLKLKLEKAFEQAKASTQPKQTFNKLLPELGSETEKFFEKLEKNNSVSSELWQELIK